MLKFYLYLCVHEKENDLFFRSNHGHIVFWIDHFAGLLYKTDSRDALRTV